MYLRVLGAIAALIQEISRAISEAEDQRALAKYDVEFARFEYDRANQWSRALKAVSEVAATAIQELSTAKKAWGSATEALEVVADGIAVTSCKELVSDERAADVIRSRETHVKNRMAQMPEQIRQRGMVPQRVLTYAPLPPASATVTGQSRTLFNHLSLLFFFENAFHPSSTHALQEDLAKAKAVLSISSPEDFSAFMTAQETSRP